MLDLFYIAFFVMRQHRRRLLAVRATWVPSTERAAQCAPQRASASSQPSPTVTTYISIANTIQGFAYSKRLHIFMFHILRDPERQRQSQG